MQYFCTYSHRYNQNLPEQEHQNRSFWNHFCSNILIGNTEKFMLFILNGIAITTFRKEQKIMRFIPVKEKCCDKKCKTTMNVLIKTVLA